MKTKTIVYVALAVMALLVIAVQSAFRKVEERLEVLEGLVYLLSMVDEYSTATPEGATAAAADTLPLQVGRSAKFGDISFATAQTWTVGAQTWSDVVQASRCSKATFDGGAAGSYLADCRSNPQHRGSLFSWTAAARHGKELCPNGWRVPTKEDFAALDTALSDGSATADNERLEVTNRYLGAWGGAYGGLCRADGTLLNQGAYAYYLSQSEGGNEFGICLIVSLSGSVSPQGGGYKSYGFPLRCVR